MALELRAHARAHTHTHHHSGLFAILYIISVYSGQIKGNILYKGTAGTSVEFYCFPTSGGFFLTPTFMTVTGRICQCHTTSKYGESTKVEAGGNGQRLTGAKWGEGSSELKGDLSESFPT